MATKLVSVEVVFNREDADGTEYQVKATISPEYGYQQYGATLSLIAENQPAAEAIENALADEWGQEEGE